ncbi:MULTISPECIES: hypothetical protein [Streptomyces]|uniref:Uncharacterized protein n=2 Tax=Streptomyces TaxID=1883 RepID=A0A2U9P1X4_STRAS|nr:hypothetical protein [Streptomyces actuosus]AWT43191.1 hypothetical protein DMT42_13240 [Streptomyces actuosus]MBM4824657.1 hypothetical protein [Streptomyces actuosus]
MQPDTLTPEQAREQLETARREAADARQLADELADRVRDGDIDVTADQLGTQRQLAELAELRIEAAERKLQAALAADREARAREVGDRVRALVADDSTVPLIDAVRAVMAAVDGLVHVAAERDAAIREVAAEGARVNDELGPDQANPWPSERFGFRAGTNPVGVTAMGQGRAYPISAGELLGTALAAALVGKSEVQRAAASKLTGIPEGVGNTVASVPGLADALRLTPEEWQTLDGRTRYEATAQGRRPLPQDTEG